MLISPPNLGYTIHRAVHQYKYSILLLPSLFFYIATSCNIFVSQFIMKFQVIIHALFATAVTSLPQILSGDGSIGTAFELTPDELGRQYSVADLAITGGCINFSGESEGFTLDIGNRCRFYR